MISSFKGKKKERKDGRMEGKREGERREGGRKKERREGPHLHTGTAFSY